MGALCSGKSENPASFDPNSARMKPTNVVGDVPKVAYSVDKINTAQNGHTYAEESDDKKARLSID
jgi:hypothetical protein